MILPVTAAMIIAWPTHTHCSGSPSVAGDHSKGKCDGVGDDNVPKLRPTPVGIR